LVASRRRREPRAAPIRQRTAPLDAVVHGLRGIPTSFEIRFDASVPEQNLSGLDGGTSILKNSNGYYPFNRRSDSARRAASGPMRVATSALK
jgi:hypothetical protein